VQWDIDTEPDTAWSACCCCLRGIVIAPYMGLCEQGASKKDYDCTAALSRAFCDLDRAMGSVWEAKIVSSDWRADGVSICSDGREDESRDDIQ
jgi:hypothetical protein